MGGLVNGRRGGRAPPLMIGALVACILLLGFNYWVSSSRNLELQTKLYELESKVRRGAVERGADEVKKYEFQKEIDRQKDQIDLIENRYKKQLEGLQNTCSQEKVTLQQNISTSTKILQELKGQLIQMNDDLGKLQKELQACQSNVKTLNDKLTYDMTHCNSQILTQKELCDERVAAAKLEAEKKMAKLDLSDVTQDTKAEKHGAKVEAAAANVSLKGSSDLSHSSNFTMTKASVLLSSYANKIVQEQDAAVGMEDGTKEAIKIPDVDLLAQTRKSSLTRNQTRVDGAAAQTQADMIATEEELNGENYDHDNKQALGGRLQLDKRQPKRDAAIDKVMEDELADYNGDDDNEGEFETDKQAELAQN
ncbi:Golgi membrane protein 1 isoform X2 [Syngnathus typhle]|uniref:Golgi membrane protein 1 isoform X2 n=1 Tax=Syngnathus typhle TaxID=161592 RepID=UPI002A6A4041|nr:Golgi membrane protein 1 isoform X2 [Syngnathus typhle]